MWFILNGLYIYLVFGRLNSRDGLAQLVGQRWGRGVTGGTGGVESLNRYTVTSLHRCIVLGGA